MAFHFIGIKGTGMAALAEILHDENKEVRGSDIENTFLPRTVWKSAASRFCLLTPPTFKMAIR